MPTTTQSKPALAPSIYHRYLLDHSPMALRYPGGLSGDDLKAWQDRLRDKLRTLLGLDHLSAPRVPLEVESLWVREHELGTIEKVRFAAEPGADVLAYVCLPREAQPPYDFMVCLQGHSPGMHVSIGMDASEEREELPAGDRDFALGCMRRGLAALCVEQRSFGQRGEKEQEKVSDHPCHDAVMQGIMLGRPLNGQRVFDVDRGIDYLESRGDVNMSTLGVMGNSGGGTTTMYSAVMLPRVRWAMPSCVFCTHRDSIMNIYHCGDNYVPGLLQYAEADDVMGLFAPRPLVIVAGKEDPIFPIHGVRKAFEGLERIYRDAGATDSLWLVEGPEGHRFYADQAWAKGMKVVAQLRDRAPQ